jgi:hypothetical protein
MWAAQYEEENNTEGKENMTACKESVRMIMKLVQQKPTSRIHDGTRFG